MNTNDKRIASVFVPYKIIDGAAFVFLQKRSKNTERAPGLFGFFGGAAEGTETPEEALLREVKEELDFVPRNFHLFRKYTVSNIKDLPETILSLFVMKVGDDFKKQIKISGLEGEHGQWFSRGDYIDQKESITGDLSILDELYDRLPEFN